MCTPFHVLNCNIPRSELDRIYDPCFDREGKRLCEDDIVLDIHSPSLTLFKITEGRQLAEVLSSEGNIFIEHREQDYAPFFPVKKPERYLLYLSLYSDTAYTADVARNICSYVSLKTSKSEKELQPLRTVLQEAIVNAVVHGNLEAEKNISCAESLANFYRSVETELASNPLKIFRKVIICLRYTSEGKFVFSVTHEGQPFPLSCKEDDIECQVKAQGRGLLMMACLSQRILWRNKGHTIQAILGNLP
jgi:hypothetical protein